MITQFPRLERPLPFLDSGLTQVAILVEDLDRTVEVYWKLFHVGPWHFYTYQKPLVSQMTYRGRPADYRMRLALSYFGPTRIELIQPLQGPSIYDEFIAKHGYGVQHFGLVVDDIQATLAQARSAGLDVIMDGSGFGADGDGCYAYLNTEELLGVTLELIERPKRRVPPEKVYPPQDDD
jgi:methylmalonyl-CoA/ethylmalonyl-CoA epimerase